MAVEAPMIRKVIPEGKWVLALAGLLILVSLTSVTVAIVTAARRPLSSLENVLFQAFSLGAGFAGSFLFGRFSAAASAREIIKPHARAAFRRLFSHFGSLSRLVIAIDRARAASGVDATSPSHYDTLKAMVVEQIRTADDALEDWRDIVPEEVEEMVDRARKRQAKRADDEAEE